MSRKLKVKIPKRVAGIKIPKAVRKGVFRDFLDSAAGQVLIAEALVVLGGALGGKRTGSSSRLAQVPADPVEELHDPSGAARSGLSHEEASIHRESARLSLAFKEAIRAFRAALEEPSAAVSPSMQGDEGIAMGAQAEPEKRKPGKARAAPASTPH
jgi:hypothetical protein